MRHKSSAGYSRGVRVSEQIHHELAELVRGELKDPRIGMVTLTGLDLTPDYAYATVWFSVLPDDPQTVANSLEGLRAAAGFLRRQVGQRVRVHTIPELRFQHDASTRRGMEMSQLIDKALSRQAREDD